jgi:hypothetical protein
MKLSRMVLATTAGLIVPAAMPLLADVNEQREKLFGRWELAAESTHAAESVWTLERKGDSVRVTYSEGARQHLTFECAPTGRDCVATNEGKRANVSLWFDGPALVEMETKGSEVVKRVFVAGENEGTLQLETIPVVPEGKPQKAHFKRVAPVSAAK